MESISGDVPDNVTVLWNSRNEDLRSFEVIQASSEGSKSASPIVDPSLGDSNIDQAGETDPIFKEEGDITDDSNLDHQPEDAAILSTDDIGESHMLHVPENDGTILSETPVSIHVTTSLSSELPANSDGDVVQLFLPNDENADSTREQLQPIISLESTQMVPSSVMSPTSQTVQAITLSDGTTAFIQHPNTVTQVKSEVSDSTVKYEDTTISLNQAVKDGLQAIILEDGTTAYLATQQTQQFMENATLEATTLTLDQLTSPVSNIQVLPHGMMNLDVKTLTIPQNGVENNNEPEEEIVKTSVVTSTPSSDKAPYVEKAYRCTYEGCGRFYTTLHHLRVHERAHTGDRPFHCDFNGCGKAFATGYGLKSHTRVHTGEKPYKCPEETCEKAFKTSGDLQKHLRTHTGERPFKCPFEGCNRSFTTSNIRKVHIRTHTGERPYICPEEGCGRAFASATNYKNHIRIHTGEKPYVCTVEGCGKRFTEYSSLYKHHVVHTHAKPYTCNRCGKTYRQTSTLAMHKRTAHGEEVTAESEAMLFQEQSREEYETPEKRIRLGFTLPQDEVQDEGEGTLIINTSDTGQQFAFVGTEALNIGTSDTVQTVPNQSSVLQHTGVATFTLGDQGQQVYVITDPAQLEALQQIAQHQFEADTLENTYMTPLPSGDINSLETNDTDVTTVTEITAAHDIINHTVPINSETNVADIQTFTADS